MVDYIQRAQNLVERMLSENLDWLVINNLYNIRYLSGFSGTHAVLVLSPDTRLLITDGRYQEQVKTEAPDYTAEIQGKRKELETLRDVLGDVSTCRIGFEAEHCSFSKAQNMQTGVQAKTWIPTEKWVEPLRAVKEPEEIQALQKALVVAEGALQEVLGQIREGMSERELAHLLEDRMWNAGAQKESFDTIVLFGPRSSLPHGQPSDVTLKKGDVILMDFGCLLDGYCSDITRMAFFGEPSQELTEMYGCVQLAQKSALEHLQAGVTCPQADEHARQVIREAGREKQFMHGLGHGVGMEIHEAPRLSFLSDETLRAGNVVTVEPGVYVPGIGGIRLENMAVVRENGCEALNQSSTDMVIL